ncbi:MAG: methyltransferase domain-containing protein [Alphaproteobacteria bacterium]|nr:methyltransferase domain-containing protein [Alphaproteobacteria bacterium]
MSQPYDRAFYEKQQDGSIRSAEIVVPIVLELAGLPTSVVDVGCGVGGWLSTFAAAGVTGILGLDGGHVARDMLRIPAECFRPTNLRRPFRIERRFDLALSLEVAEHLPNARSAGFVADLVALAPVVLFSAAIPGQGGTHHINEQWPDHWAERFAGHDYLPIDAIRPRIWLNSAVQWWYCQNLLLFAHVSAIEARGGLAEARRNTRPQQLSLVHPRRYLMAEQKHRRLAEAFRELKAKGGN